MSLKNYEYLHYWFSSSGMSIYDFNQAKRNLILESQLSQMESRIQKMITGDQDEAGQLIDFLTSSSMADARKEAFEGQMSQKGGARSSGLNGLTYGQLARRSSADIQAMIDDLTNGIDDFVTQLENWIKEAYKSLCLDTSYESYKQALVKEYITIRKIPSSEIGTSIINDLLSGKHNGLRSLPFDSNALGGSDPMRTAIRNLTLIASAIPAMNGTISSFKSGIHSNGMEVINEIAGKVSGMLSNVAGTGAEVAMAKAEEKVVGEVSDNLIKSVVAKQWGTQNVQKTYYGDPNMQKDAENKDKTYTSTAKTDILVSVNGNNCNITYGINMKNYTPPNSATSTGSVSIVSNTSLINAAHKADISDYYFINLAAAHGGLSPNNKSGENITDYSLNKNWSETIEYIAYSNLLTALAGEALNFTDNILFFIVNGNVFTISEVLTRLLENNGMGLTAYLLKGNEIVTNRSTFSRYNRWIFSTNDKINRALSPDKGFERSQNEWPKVYQQLSNTKLNIDLNMLGSLMM